MDIFRRERSRRDLGGPQRLRGRLLRGRNRPCRKVSRDRAWRKGAPIPRTRGACARRTTRSGIGRWTARCRSVLLGRVRRRAATARTSQTAGARRTMRVGGWAVSGWTSRFRRIAGFALSRTCRHMVGGSIRRFIARRSGGASCGRFDRRSRMGRRAFMARRGVSIGLHTLSRTVT